MLVGQGEVAWVQGEVSSANDAGVTSNSPSDTQASGPICAGVLLGRVLIITEPRPWKSWGPAHS